MYNFKIALRLILVCIKYLIRSFFYKAALFLIKCPSIFIAPFMIFSDNKITQASICKFYRSYDREENITRKLNFILNYNMLNDCDETRDIILLDELNELIKFDTLFYEYRSANGIEKKIIYRENDGFYSADKKRIKYHRLKIFD